MSDWLSDFVHLVGVKGGGTLGTSLFRNQHKPGQSVDVVTTVVSPTGGTPINTSGIDFPTAQVIHRHKTFDAAWTAAMGLYLQLRNTEPLQMGAGPAYTFSPGIKALSPPASLTQDEAGAWLVVTNYEIEIMAE